MSEQSRLTRIIKETYGSVENAQRTPVGRAMIAAADEAARKSGCTYYSDPVVPCNPPRVVTRDNRDHSRKA